MINKISLISCAAFLCVWLSATECRSAGEEIENYTNSALQPLMNGHEGDEENHEGAAQQAPSPPPIVHVRVEEHAHWALGLCMDGCVESLRQNGQQATTDATPSYLADPVDYSLSYSFPVRHRVIDIFNLENNDPWWHTGIAFLGRILAPLCRGLPAFFPFLAAHAAEQTSTDALGSSMWGLVPGAVILISNLGCGLCNRPQAITRRSYLITTAIDLASVSLMGTAYGILSQNTEQFACPNDPASMCKTINPSVIEACQGLLITSGILNLYGLGRSLYSGWRR